MSESTEIVVADGDRTFSPSTYNKMRKAIADCVSIDDCMKAQSVAAAMATYYQQVNDREAVRQLEEIRLRAWRRMAEIVSRVDVSKCSTQKAMAQKVRDELGVDATSMLSDSRIIQLIKLAGVPERNFEKELAASGASIDAIIRKAHPNAIRERQEAQDRQRQWEQQAEERSRKSAEAAKNEADKEQVETAKKAAAILAMVKENAIIEAPEVGLTLSPKVRDGLVSFSVMMDKKMHEQLRDAAHERHTTMWAILREAANYWFVVNGYEKV
jgi:hypothetical protein